MQACQSRHAAHHRMHGVPVLQAASVIRVPLNLRNKTLSACREFFDAGSLVKSISNQLTLGCANPVINPT